MSDVCKEATIIRNALAVDGWNYSGGGPYPHAPTLSFRRGDDMLRVKLGPVEKKPNLEEHADG